MIRSTGVRSWRSWRSGTMDGRCARQRLRCVRIAAGLVVVLLELLVAADVLRAQVATATLTGVVRDPSGMVASGAALILTDETTGTSRSTASNAEGVYLVAALPSGAYSVQVGLPGVGSARSRVRLSTGETARLDIQLEIDTVTEQVTVVADLPALRTERPGLATVVDADHVASLPLNGRAFVSLATLAPGVALPPASLLPRINGGRPRANEYLFDGISVLQPEPGQVAYLPVIDSIQDFRIETNSPPAEFGRFNGGVVNLTTRSGTNAVHGTAFEFLRHESLNARNYFQAADERTPIYRRSQFGGTLGGPIVKDRTFFFLDFQGQRQAIGRTVISTVPTLLQRQGIFTEALGGRVPAIYDPATTGGSPRAPFPGNSIPVSRFDPVAVALLSRYPQPISSGTSNNYRRTANEVNDQEQWSARFDHHLSPREALLARVTRFHDAFAPVSPLPDGSGATRGTPGVQDSVAWSFVSGYRRELWRGLVNELRIGETRRAVDRRANELQAPPSATLGLPGIPSSAQFPNTLPTFVISGYQHLGSPANTASSFRTGVFQIANALSWTMGRHALKAGLDWRWSRLDVIQPPSPTGTFTFSSLFTDQPGVTGTGSPLASFLLGQVQTFAIDLQAQRIQERAHVQEYFLQDDWKVSDRLTLSPGLRYTLNFPSTEINGQTAVLNLGTRLLEYPGAEPVRRLHKNNVGPRLGMAYRASDRTVVGLGYGLVWIDMAGITTPFTTPTFPFVQTVSQRTLDNVSPAFVLRNGPSITPVRPSPTAGLGQGVFTVDRDLGSGYVQQWNASLQRAIVPSTTLEVAYTGSKITHVGIPDANINQLSVEQLGLGAPLTERVPNPYFGTIPASSSLGEPTIPRAQLLKPFPEYTAVSYYRNNVGTTFYQGLQIGVRRRPARGLSYSVSYTRSKLVDDASSVFDASIPTGAVTNAPVADSFNRRRERDNSTGDIPHVLTGSLVWDLSMDRADGTGPAGRLAAMLRGWTIAVLATVQSGSPISVTQATNFNAFAGFGIQRPNLVGDPQLPAGARSANQWFDPSAFAIAQPFTIGSASRNPVRGPSYRTVDLALMRRLPTGPVAFDLRVEVFNVLNTANLGPPSGLLGASDFGAITTAFDPRVAQLAVRMVF